MEASRICASVPMRVGFLMLTGLAAALLCSSCSPAKDPATGRRESPPVPPSPSLTQAPIPPNACRVRATILAIDSSVSSDSSTDPCSRYPCRATVRIDEVLGYGSAFSTPLAAGGTLPVRFTLTLAPSAVVFPEMNPGLPGLTAGDSFAADIEGGGPAIGGAARLFTVRTYTPRK